MMTIQLNIFRSHTSHPRQTPMMTCYRCAEMGHECVCVFGEMRWHVMWARIKTRSRAARYEDQRTVCNPTRNICTAMRERFRLDSFTNING